MGVTVLTVLLMWACALCSHVSPEGFGWYGVVSMMFPVFALINLVCFVAWLLVRPRYALVPLIGALLCLNDLRAYCPVNFPQKPPKGCIKVFSYNVHNFANETWEIEPKIIDNIINARADIVLMQETETSSIANSIVNRLKSIYKYDSVSQRDSVSTTLRCMSNYEIIKSELLPFKNSLNAATAFYLRLPDKDTLIVLTTHLESDGISLDELKNYDAITSGNQTLKNSKAKVGFISLLRKLKTASSSRSVQADSVHSFVKRHRGTPLIVCGDFNDTPVSYTHRTVGKGLTDAYIATGCGPGFSYSRHNIRVRIDNMMCSSELKPYRAKIVSSAKGSDHYPIECFFKLKGK